MERVPQHFGYHIEITQGFILSEMITALAASSTAALETCIQSLPDILGNAVVSKKGESLISPLLFSFTTGKNLCVNA